VNGCITLQEVSSTQHDFWIPGFSCSWIFGHTVETVPNEPYIFAKPESVNIWKQIIKGDNPKIGIRWSGNPQFEHQQFRIFPPELMINLHKEFDHIQWYSLQRDNDLRELPQNITDLQHTLISWEDTAACIENLDLIISSCTSIAHLASSMGKPTWVIVPILPYHVWAYGDKHSPWYTENTRVFRQTVFGKWDNTFETIKDELNNKFPKK
jgi:ADP-heptose:LPS heptosyltransferase